MQEELGQRPEKHKENTQSVTGRINDGETHIGEIGVGNTEKTGWKADSVSVYRKQTML